MVKKLVLMTSVFTAFFFCTAGISTANTDIKDLSFDMGEYFPLAAGSEWIYEYNNKSDIADVIVTIDGTEMINDIETTIINVNQGNNEPGNHHYADFVAMDNEGLKTYKDKNLISGDYRIETTPVFEFPKAVKIGQHFSDRHDWVTYFSDGKLEGGGTTEIMGRIESVESVDVPFGKFDDCLKFVSFGAYDEKDGTLGHYLEIKWLAKGFGMVKYFRSEKTDRSSGGTETHSQTWELKKAVIAGKPI